MKPRIRYSERPPNWRALQDKVRQIFSDMGYKATVGKKIGTARGRVEIDVFAEKRADTKTTLLCECKHWRSRVPQSVVHSFLSVVQNYGANTGYIISRAGFNSGAYRAARFTNIHLLTWDQFRQTFEKQWLKGISPRIRDDFALLMDCTEPIIATSAFKKAEKLSANRREKFKKLRDTFIELGLRVTMFATLHLPASEFFELRFPIVIPAGRKRYTFHSSWEFVDWLYEDGIQIQRQFRQTLR